MPVEIAIKSLTDQWKNLKKALTGNKSNPAITESGGLIFTALLVGVASGFGAVAFKIAIEKIQELVFNPIEKFPSYWYLFFLILIPIIGSLINTPMILRYAREAKGHGVPEVMEAVAVRGGRIKPQVGIVKTITSALCIGTGGSVGSEGPIALIGASIGSFIGQKLHLSEERMKTLVACGAAGGIAAIFNAPIGGAIFALEIILNRMNTLYFGAVVISAVTADAIAHALLGNNHAFNIPQYFVKSPWEFILYLLLAVIAAFASVTFTKLLYWSEDFFRMLKMPELLKPALGSLLLGIIGVITIKNASGFPRIYGVGYETISLALFGELTIKVTLILFAAKLFATVFVLGSGNSGGIFAPSLYLGSMLGAGFGKIATYAFPNIVVGSGAYALVGMAAFYSGATHAPMTAILILFEMTNNYQLILPLMISSVLSMIISKMISPDSINTLKLTRKGIHLSESEDIDIMQTIMVDEAMAQEFDVVPADLPLPQLYELFQQSHRNGFPIIDPKGNLIGVVTRKDLEKGKLEGDIINKSVSDIATTQGLLVAYPKEPIWKALYKMSSHDIAQIPVVESPESRKMVGLLHREDIIRAYDHAIAKKAGLQYSLERVKLGKLDNAGFLTVNLTSESKVIGKKVSEIKLPQQCNIVSLRRGRRLQIVNGQTVLRKGDQLTIFADEECVDEVQRSLFDPGSQKIEDLKAQMRYLEILIPAGAECNGRMIKDLKLPKDVIIVSILRNRENIIPHGNALILTDDVLEVYGPEDQINATEVLLTQ